MDYCGEEDAFGKTSDCISELVFSRTVGGSGKAFHRRLGNILYSDSDAAPLARLAKKLEIWSDLYKLSQNHISSLSFLHTKALCLCWFTPFFSALPSVMHGGSSALGVLDAGQPHQTRGESTTKLLTSRLNLGFKQECLQMI